MGLVPAACDRVGETTGGAAHDERRDQRVSLCRVGLAPTASLKRHDWPMSGGGGCPYRATRAVCGAARVPGLAGADHGVQVSQDRCGDDGLCLGRLEPVVLTRGEVAVAGAIDGVRALGAPDRAP